MKMSQAKSGVGLLVFALVCIFAITTVFYAINSLISTSETNTRHSGLFVYSGEAVPVDWDEGRQRSNGLMFRLSIDRPMVVGNARIFYRGLTDNNRFVLDVMLPDLDPEAYYPYVLNISEAREGFRLADRNFKLITADRHNVKMFLLE